MKKQEVLEMLAAMPDELDPEALIDELFLKIKLDKAEAAIAAGDVLTHDQLRERAEQWCK